MKETSRELTIALASSGLEAKIAITRDEQDDPWKSDLVVAVGRMLLPSQGSWEYIPKSLQFSDRAHVLGQRLNQDWGVALDEYKGFRSARKYYRGKTWREVFAEAETDLRAELQKLIDMLEVRQQALIDAEK